MNFDEFCDLVGRIYDNLTDELRNKFTVSAEEFPSDGAKEVMAQKGYIRLYGYWHPITPNNVVMCYWGFKDVNDFSETRIEAVLKHEVEHSLTAPFGCKHSEHS